MSFWDDLKDLFKTDDQKDEEQKRRLAEAKEGEQELEKQLAELDKKYKESKPAKTYDVDSIFPRDSGLKEVEYTPRSDEDILNSATKENEYQKAKEKNKVESGFESSLSALDKSKSQADKSLKESFADLEKVYNELRQKAENDAIKRGVARSSIIMSQLGNLDEAKMLSAGEIESAYRSTIGDINTKINSLEQERENALSELDLKYASELANRIADLKAERDETALQYEKYNNQIREQQTKYETQRQKNIEKYLSDKAAEEKVAEKTQEAYEKEHGYTGEKLAEYENRYNLAYDFYMSLSPDIAVNALKTANSMKYYLGNYYDKLLTELKSRVTTINGTRRTYW